MKRLNLLGYTLTEKEKNVWVIEPKGNMNVPVIFFANEHILENIKDDQSIVQATNVAALPGIQKASIVMPDCHEGYGFSIGGVAAFDLKEGIISPGGIGFDINCGVRLLASNKDKEQIISKIKEILERLYVHCPVGVGSESKLRLTDEELDSLMKEGAEWAVKHNYGTKEDLEHCEAEGKLPDADPSKVSHKAKARGRQQIGTVGAGNHFIEIQYVDEIYDKKIAEVFGITHKGQVTVMIHCGSRGFGHQICSDYIRRMEDEQSEIVKRLKDKNLIYAPLNTKLADDYFKAMNCAANFAFCNRHMLAHHVRLAFKEIFDNVELKTVYDVCHNIAKKEKHIIDGVEKEVIVHRKGATRAFPPGSKEIPVSYISVGQPVIIPGSMGTASYLLVGTQRAMEISFGSTAHGAGRVMSRSKAIHSFRGENIKRELESHNIFIKAASLKGISEEAPQAYKDVDEVIKVSDEVGIAKKIARLKPIGVIKG